MVLFSSVTYQESVVEWVGQVKSDIKKSSHDIDQECSDNAFLMSSVNVSTQTTSGSNNPIKDCKRLRGMNGELPSDSYLKLNEVEKVFRAINTYLSKQDLTSSFHFQRIYLQEPPFAFQASPLVYDTKGKDNLYCYTEKTSQVISQNNSKRKVHRYLWKVSKTSSMMPVAVKFVSDQNSRDGRSLKREVECHMYSHMKLSQLYQDEAKLWQYQSGIYSFTRMDEWVKPQSLIDAWPSSELIAYHVDKVNPGNSILITRKLSGPDFFDIIRCEHNHAYNYHKVCNSNQVRCSYTYEQKTLYSTKPNQRTKLHSNICNDFKNAHQFNINESQSDCQYYSGFYDYFKLRFAALTLRRLNQFHSISVRHNDVKPDNIVCDFHKSSLGQPVVDVKLIDLGTATLAQTRDFTGGTSWYESPEQKLLEFFGKKKRDYAASNRVSIDLSSDAWGAGLSLAEVLLGKRVVDSLKMIPNMGPLEYIGRDDVAKSSRFNMCFRFSPDHSNNLDYYEFGGNLECYPFWRLQPTSWLTSVKNILFEKTISSNSLLNITAEWLFDNLVVANPAERAKINAAMNVVEQFAEEQYSRTRYEFTSFKGKTDSYSTFCWGKHAN